MLRRRGLAVTLVVGAVGLIGVGMVTGQGLAVGGLLGAALVFLLLVWALRRPGHDHPVDWRQIEVWTAAWLRDQGCRDVALTGAGADGGIDVVTREWAVQVKHTERRVGRPAVQQIVGAALAADRRPAIVATSGFSAPAVDYANEQHVALLEMDTYGRAQRLNAAAHAVGPERRRALFRRPSQRA